MHKSFMFNVLLFVFRQANLDEQQASSNQFVRALMTNVCQLAIVCKYERST